MSLSSISVVGPPTSVSSRCGRVLLVRSQISGVLPSASISCWAVTTFDLALAVLLETRLSGGERGHISGPRWDQLVALCRDLKEKVLSGNATADDRFAVTLPGRGSGLIAGVQTANLARDEVERLVLDGFFPLRDTRARPYRVHGALQEWGLPYAADSAVTNHLADFLRERMRVDAVLFNGGLFHAALLRER